MSLSYFKINTNLNDMCQLLIELTQMFGPKYGQQDNICVIDHMTSVRKEITFSGVIMLYSVVK